MTTPTELYVPDGASGDQACARVTDLGVVAHPDDLEFLAVAAIGACAGAEGRWFGGVVCTDGAGSTQGADPERILAVEDLVRQRADEQRAAARVGEYSFVAMIGESSDRVRDREGQASLVDRLTSVLDACRPTTLYTHNLADKHDTHVAVAVATIKAVRRLPLDARPLHLFGVEGWRDLDWLPDDDKVRMDVSPHATLADELASVFTSQLGDKRYDLAAAGRRRANATIFEPREPDDAEQVVVAMDLTPLARDDDLDPKAYVLDAVDRFRDEVERAVGAYW